MRVLLIAAEPVFRLGFRALLASSGDLQLAADASDARAGFRLIDHESPDVVVMSVGLPGMNGIAASREVRRRAPGARILVVAPWPRERDVRDAFAAGAQGFALTTEPAETLLGAIRTVAAGGRYLPPNLRGLGFERGPAGTSLVPTDLLAVLSPREREVLDLVIRGWRNRQIARELCVSIKTIDTHRTHINRKLRCASTSDLIRFAADNGLLQSAPSSAAASPRTVVLLMDTDPIIQHELLLQVAAPAGGPAPTVADLCRQLLADQTQTPLVLTFDPDVNGLAVRAAVSLPPGDASERFVAALERAAALQPAAPDRRARATQVA